MEDLKYKELADAIELSVRAKETLKKAKEQENAKLSKGYAYVEVKNGLEVLCKVDKNGEPIDKNIYKMYE